MAESEGKEKGRTLWEMFLARVRGAGNSGGISFEDPLDLRVGSGLPVAWANGPEFAHYDFTVQEIREYNRQVGGREFRFTDYVLHGINTQSFDAGDALTVRVRVAPSQAGTQDKLMLRLYDEFAFAEDFLAVLKDASGVLEVADDAHGTKTSFSRVNDLRESWQAHVMVVAATTPEGKAVPDKVSAVRIEYWDFWRDAGGGDASKEFLFAEVNSETGWFQLWRGREFFSQP